MKIIRLTAAFIAGVALLATSVHPWSNHYLFNREALAALPEIADAPKVKVESLEDFLLKEQAGVSELLAKVEKEAKESYAKKAPLPEALAFKGGDASNIRANFLRAIRINPGTPLGYFLQQLPGKKLPGKPADPNKVSIFGEKDLKRKYIYYQVKQGDMVSPLEVLAAAGDEPDFGIDINLFVDNNEKFSQDYGFGNQSFGNPKLYYGTQAPFHIGYYHESGIIFMAAGFLKRTYPRYRVHQFMNLARYAFKTGHPYWGYRFLGWGLHYVGDLTQPYHARVLPNYGTMGMLWINTKAMIGFPKSKDEAIDRITARHTAIEEYHFSVMAGAYAQNNLEHPFLQNLRNTGKDTGYGTYNDDYIVEKITEESYDISDKIDTLIDEANLLQGFSEGNVLPEINKAALAELDKVLAAHMQGVGAHLRNYVRAGLK
ncbi:MAG: phospholipase [Spirochaetota bacterium]